MATFALRALWIDHPALWTDEVFTILYARQDLGDLLSLTRTSDIHPPFYYILVKAVSVLFGEGDGTGLRLVSATASALAAGLIFLFGRHRFGIGIATLATLFFILLPVNVHFGRELRTYSWLAFALLLAILCFVEMTEPGRSQRARRFFTLGYIASLVVAFHFHYSAIVFFLLFGIAMLALWVQKLSDTRMLRHAVLATGAAGCLCLPQSVHFFWSRSYVSADFWIAPTTWGSFYRTSLGLYPFPGWAKPIVYALYILGAWLLWKRDRRFATIALTFLVGGPVSVALLGLMTPAYLVRSIQAFATLSPFLLALCVAQLPRPAALLALLALVGIHLMAIRPDYPRQREQLAIDGILPLIEPIEAGQIYYFDALEPQLVLRHVDHRTWIAVSLDQTDAPDQTEKRLRRCTTRGACAPRVVADGIRQISDRLERCSGQCGPTVVIMERAPPGAVDPGRAWMAALDTMASRYGAGIDTDIAGMRVVVVK